jgi:hypothetical protein
MSKYYVAKFEIDAFNEPLFETEEEAQKWFDTYLDDLAMRDSKLGVKWDECSWRIESNEQE